MNLQKRNKVILRTDGNAEIGMGHITRSLALAEMLNEHFDCYLASRYLTESIKAIVLKICEDIVELNKDNHESQLLEYLDGSEIVVLDNYFYPKKFRSDLKSKGVKVICIDDLGGDFTFCDIIINHSPNAINQKYIYDSDARLLFGLDYALLRKPFLNSASQPIIKTNCSYKNVFICFGGSDHKNLTRRIIQNINKLKKFEQINVVIGNAYEHIKNLESYLANIENAKLFKGLNAIQMIDLMLESDFAIVPSSGILFEVISVKLPVITGFYAKNQKKISDFFVGKNIGYVIGDFSSNRITSDHLNFNTDMKLNMSNLIDGQSDKRILKAFQELQYV